MRTALALSALLAAAGFAAANPSIEIGDASTAKAKFNKKSLKTTAVVGYLPNAESVEAFNKVCETLQGIDCYHISDRAALETLGLVSADAYVAVYRPWAPAKQFKTSYRREIAGLPTNKIALRDWILQEALPPLAFTPASLHAAYDKLSEARRIPMLRWFINTNVEDHDVKKPDDWDQPERIEDPAAEKPDDWDEAEDGQWSPPMIDNPAFKGEWRPQRKSLLIDDPTDEKPADWDQPETIPDPKGTKPADWDESEDGPWEPPPPIPNPAYRGNWTARQVPPLELTETILEALAPVQKKYAKKLIFTIEDVDGGASGRAAFYRWNDDDYKAGTTVAIEEKKYSTLKYDNKDFGISGHNVDTGKRFKYPGEKGFDSSALMKFVDDWAAKKLVDEAKKRRLEEKEASLKKAETGKKEGSKWIQDDQGEL